MLLSIVYRGKKRLARGALPSVVIMAVLAVVLNCNQSLAAKPRHEVFSSPTDAVRTMVDAMKAGDTGRLLGIYGRAGKELFSSGDDAADRQAREEFVKAYDEKNRLEAVGRKKVILHVGKEDWPWPIPIVRTDQGWRFDTREGRQEILARRIGENELAVIQVCLAYVDAQREYARDQREGSLMEYAQKFVSDPGKRNGLSWEGEEGKQSPLGPLLSMASRENQGAAGKGDEAQSYHGYFYKILKKQGKDAPGGAYDYLVDGRMIGGFALVAYPARYGSSGIMTFIVNQDGVIYERDLGKNTEKAAEAMTSFDPDQTWKEVR